MELLLKVLTKLFTSSFMEDIFTPILKGVWKCKVTFISPCLLTMGLSARNRVVTNRGNSPSQINRVEGNACCTGQAVRPLS